MQRDVWYWRRARSNPPPGVSDGSDGARPLWRSHSARTEMIFADVANLVTVTKMTMIVKIPWVYGPLRTTAVRIRRQVSCRAVQSSQLLVKSPADLHRGLSCSNIWPSYKSNLVASWMHLYYCRCFQEHTRMLLQSLRALCLAPAGPGSTWKHIGAPVWSTRVCGRSLCGSQTDLHFADGVVN